MQPMHVTPEQWGVQQASSNVQGAHALSGTPAAGPGAESGAQQAKRAGNARGLE